MHHYGYGMGGGWLLLGGLVLLLFIGGLILLGVLLYGASKRDGGTRTGAGLEPPTQPENALEILDQRYARGEINREEYREIKQDLEGGT